MDEITEEEFRSYEEVRKSRKFNMFEEGREASNAAGLSLDTYKTILFNYDELKKKFDD